MSFYFKKRFSFVLILILFIGIFVYQIPIIKADVILENAQAAKALSEADLQAELDQLDVLIAQQQALLTSQKGQSVSISRDISILTSQIAKSKLDIKAKTLIIQKLGGEITVKSNTIVALSTKIDKEKESLAQLIRKANQIDDTSIVALILSQNSVSDAYGDIDTFASINRSIQASVSEIKGVRVLSESDKQQLLSISKGKEAGYQQVLADKAKKRAEILAAIFNLVGGSTKINFETALTHAKEAQTQTGIDPAFLLAILTQESNLGANVGQCYLTDITTGAGVGANTGKIFSNVMKPMGLSGRKGDIDEFFAITSALGRDPYQTLVSCPIAGV